MIDEIEKQLINDVLWIAVDLTGIYPKYSFKIIYMMKIEK